MKEFYQPKGGKKGKFALRENTYRRTWYLIADYPYFKAIQRGHSDALSFSEVKEEQIEVINSIPISEVQFDDNQEVDRGSACVHKAAERLFEYELELGQCERYIAAIEDAQGKVPEVYVNSIMSHIIDRKQYKDMREVSERTLKIWVQRFIWYVAHNLGDA